ncbi:MAG: DEAD/DEAH box helicase, partial [Nitrococcus sp.]|nr:DEAD/DEAH box helicase [Nitrococcus sp.]
VRTYGKHLALRSTVVVGGVGIIPQINALRRGVDVLVATPGRLLDHLQQKTVDLSRVHILVLDEADRMLDMGFIRDIRKILAALPKQRQNLLFSATFSREIRALADQLLHEPASVDIAPHGSVTELVTHTFHPVPQSRKRALLSHLIGQGNWRQVLVFTRTKHGANRLATQLDHDGLSATAIHSSKSQSARTKALKDFKHGRVRVLVATDIAARGIDIEALPHVVNYELSNIAEDYVHRIGRTGRAGSEGQAVSLVSSDERKHLAAIERLLGRRLPLNVIEGFEPETGSEGRSAISARPNRPHRKPSQNGYPNSSGRPGHNTRPGSGRRTQAKVNTI